MTCIEITMEIFPWKKPMSPLSQLEQLDITRKIFDNNVKEEEASPHDLQEILIQYYHAEHDPPSR